MNRRYKLVFLSWFGAYILITVIFVVGGSWLQALPLLLRTLLLSLIMILALNFLIVPLLARWFSRWLDK